MLTFYKFALETVAPSTYIAGVHTNHGQAPKELAMRYETKERIQHAVFFVFMSAFALLWTVVLFGVAIAAATL